MPAGPISVAAVAATVGGLLVWTMAAHDPYWRLFEAPSMPAPAYESAEDIEAALASVEVAAPHPDSAAVRPAPDDAARPGRAPQPPLALMPPRPADPMIAVPAAFAPDADRPDPAPAAPAAAPASGADAPATVLAHVPEATRPGPALPPAPAADAAAPAERGAERGAKRGAEAGAEPAAVPAPLPLAVTLHVPEASAAPVVAELEPVVVPHAPEPLRIRADSTSEEGLALARADRIRVQRRLALAGFDPRGFDGIFGPRTRQAIADFQLASGFPATGYLDGSVLADLRARTEEAYAAYAARAARDRRAAPKQAPVAEQRQLADASPSGGCARDASGRIIPQQSFGCDIKGFAEKAVSLGHDRLAFEERGGLTGFGARPDR